LSLTYKYLVLLCSVVVLMTSCSADDSEVILFENATLVDVRNSVDAKVAISSQELQHVIGVKYDYRFRFLEDTFESSQLQVLTFTLPVEIE